MKSLFWLLGTALLICFGLIPEGLMYTLWNYVNPQDQFAKILLGALFWFGGAGACALFAALAFLGWAAMTAALLETRR